MKKKSYFILFIVLILIVTTFYFFYKENLKVTDKLEPKLVQKESDNDSILYEYIITNKDNKDVKLVFGSWLEYNISVNPYDNKEFNTDINAKDIIEHETLNRIGKENGRTIYLEPNKSIKYLVKINKSELPSGKYEFYINFSPVNIEEFNSISRTFQVKR